MPSAIAQRIADWRLERQIARLRRECIQATNNGHTLLAADRYRRMCDAIRSRSPKQVERMERSMGIRNA